MRYLRAYNDKRFRTYQVDESVKPVAKDFISKRGSQFTKFVFNIEDLPQFEVIDFNWNANTHLIKLTENKFEAALIERLDAYCVEHQNDPNAKVKMVEVEHRLPKQEDQVNKQLDVDNLFKELDEENQFH